MELPNVQAAVVVAALNDEHVAIRFELPRLIRACVGWLETAFHDMRDDAVGLVGRSPKHARSGRFPCGSLARHWQAYFPAERGEARIIRIAPDKRV